MEKNLAGRAIVCACVVSAHVIWVLLMSRSQHRMPRSNDDFLGVIFMIKPQSITLPANKLRAPRKNLKIPIHKPVEPAPITNFATQLPGAPPVDWHKQATQAATDMAKRWADDEGRGSIFPSSKSNASSSTSEGAGLFRPPLHKRGDSVRTEEGEVVTWLDDKCYATNKDFGPPRESANSVVIVCKGNIGKPIVDGDLLKHLQPKYLQRPEP